MFQWYPAETGLFRLYTPAIDTTSLDSIEINFKHYINHYSGPYTLKVETSQDKISWSTVWEIENPGSGGGDVSAMTSTNVGGTTYVSWTFEGNSYNINYWFIYDIVIKGYTSFDPEYEDYRCTTTIEPGEELELEFDDWTPAYLSEETSGTKIYLVKAWTDLNNPQDENPDNDLFSKIIELDFFHDVGIKEIASPLLGSDKRFYAVNYDYPSNFSFIWFDSDDPGTFYDIGPWPNNDFPQGGTFVKDVMWVCDTNGNIFKKKDPNSPEYEYVGNSGTGELVDLAYHEKTKVLYGASGNNLYTINMETGKASLIGPFQQLGYYMIRIDCDRDGIMYGFDDNFDQGRIYTINLTTGKATCVGITGFGSWSEMEYDYDNGLMYVIVNKGQGWELYAVNFKTHEWTYKGTLYNQITCFAIPYTTPEKYIPLGSQDIDVIVENNGTFSELDLTCYAEIYEYITNCTNGTLVYEDNITDIDLNEPLGGTKALNFNSYNFAAEGLYDLFLSIPDNDDDYPNNNQVILRIGADGTPPVTNHSLDPATPDGENGWYISDVEVTIYAEDPNIGCEIPGSGVKEIGYTVDGVSGTITGDYGSFIVHYDGDDILIEYWAVDNVGNTEAKHTFYINMDQTKPDVKPIEWDAYMKGLTWYVKFTCQADDATSGMDQVKMYINDELYETITGPGPTYEFNIEWSSEFKTAMFKFVAFDTAGNSAHESVNGSVIKSNPSSQSSQQSSNNQNLLCNLLFKQMAKTSE